MGVWAALIRPQAQQNLSQEQIAQFRQVFDLFVSDRGLEYTRLDQITL
jgi:hypothetical protein